MKVIYKIFDIEDPSQSYIGSTKNLKARMRTHIQNLSSPKQLVSKYFEDKIDRLDVMLLEIVFGNNLSERESYWVKTLSPSLKSLSLKKSIHDLFKKPSEDSIESLESQRVIVIE